MAEPAGATSNPTAENQAATANAADPIPAMVKLLRFIHVNNVKCVFGKLKPVSLDNIGERLNFILQMGDELPITIIKKAYEAKNFVRPDEALVALAYCVRQAENEKLRVQAYSVAAQIIKDQADFLLFVKYCADINAKLHGNNRKGFGSGLRKMVGKWYGQYTPLELANIFGEHRGQHKWTHRDLWSLAHLKRTNVVDGTEAAADSAATAVDSDRDMVVKFIFKDGQEYLKYLHQSLPSHGSLPEGAARLKALQMFKTNENVTTAIEQIRTHGFTLKYVPSHLLHHVSVWDALLPSMSYTELLDNLFTLKDLGHLKDGQPFVTQYLNALARLEDCSRSEPKVCPVSVFTLKTLYEKDLRYLAPEKSSRYERKMEKRGLKSDKRIAQRLNIILDHAMIVAKPTPAKFFLTIDLNKNTKKKFVVNNKHITCLQASLVLALSITKREKGAVLYTFTEEPNKLKRLEMPKNITFNTALKNCTEKCTGHTRQNLKAPLAVAVQQGREIDVFITIVDSVARFDRGSGHPLKELHDYKSEVNPCAKYIVINLARPVADCNYTPADDPTGFMEICGFNKHVPKLIDAFARNAFY